MKKDWPADKVGRRKVAELVPYAKNSRTHSDRQIEQIAASIQEWGWTTPVLVDEAGGIIAGHGRILAAERLGIKDVPCMVAAGWSDEQKRAYVIADNKLTDNGGWADDILRDELKAIGEAGFNLDLTGFDELEIDSFLADKTEGLTDPDEVPDAPDRPVTARGDIWVCGNHRLLCGDSTVETDVAAVLNGVKPHLMVTDPPYGVEYDADFRNGIKRADGSIVSARAVGKVENDDRADWREAYDLFPGDVAYAWSADLRSKEAIEGLEASGFEIRAQIIWAKNQIAIGRGHYHFQHEPCWYAVRKSRTGHWNGDRKQSTLWQIDKPRKSETGHSTQKPVECMRRPIVNNSSPGQAVYEPFCGSGTTMIAAEMEGRHAYCIELSETYCDVIVKRWQAFTGASAVLEGDGHTFDEIAAVRAQEAA